MGPVPVDKPNAVVELREANRSKRQAEEILSSGSLGWRNRRYWKRQFDSASTRADRASDVYDRVVAPVETDLHRALDVAEERMRDLGPMPTEPARPTGRGLAVERSLERAAGAELDFGIEL